MNSSLGLALSEWERIIGNDNVITQPSALSFAQTATFKTTQHLLAIIQPGSHDEIQACVRIANEHGIPVYPVSTGRNWGYGSRVPPRDGCVLMRLHRLNRVLEHDEELGYVTLEPGVTQRQLHDYLQARKSKLIVPTTGSSPDTSILGNAMERGMSAVGRDKNECICALEVVLPNGECIHTGFGRFPNAQATSVNRWGVGPTLDGLFLQSSFGIVTRMTIWLMRRRPHFALSIFLLKEASSLPRLLASIRNLLRSGGFPEECGGIHLVNSYKILTYRRGYPWEEMKGQLPLTKEMLPRLFPKNRKDVGWYGAAVVTMPSAALVKAYKRIIKANLSEAADAIYCFDNRFMSLLNFVSRVAGWLRHDDVQAVLETRQGPLFGIPKPGGNLRAVYWRKKFVPSSPDDYEPDRDRCGVIWLFVVLRFEPDVVDWATKVIEKNSFAFGFEPVIEIHAMSHRSVLLGLALFFDRELSGEDERARQCHDEIFEIFVREGHYPYRLGIQHADMLPSSTDYYDQFLADLKRAVDPKCILAPGRYEFGHHQIKHVEAASL